jgi:uncharacterized protein DUF1566/curli production assembly/transport component CsgG
MQKVLTGLAFLLLITSIANSAEKPKIKRVENYLAVLDIESVGKLDKDIARPLTDSVRREIVRSGKYEVMDRGNMDKILKEQAFQMTGCTAKECAVEAGQLLGVGKIVVGSVSIVGKTYLLSLSLVNVETGKIELVEDQECKCEIDNLIQMSRQVAGKLMGTIVTGTAAASTFAATSDVKPEKNATEDMQNKEQDCRETDGRYCDYGSGTISDTSTGLVWQQIADDRERTWVQAIAYCRGLKLAGKNDWRLPNIDELESIVDKASKGTAINMAFFLDAKPEHYWPSTIYEGDTKGARYLNFSSGSKGWHDKTRSNYVRCVRK